MPSAKDQPEKKHKKPLEELSRKVEAKEARKLRAREEGDRSIWYGFGMMGLIGWSVAIPTLIGIALGVWIDIRWPSRFSWTLMLLFIGVVLGCLQAWHWVKKESQGNGDKDS